MQERANGNLAWYVTSLTFTEACPRYLQNYLISFPVLTFFMAVCNSAGFAIPLIFAGTVIAFIDPMRNPKFAKNNNTPEVRAGAGFIIFTTLLLIACLVRGELTSLLTGFSQSFFILGLHLCFLKRPTTMTVAQTVHNVGTFFANLFDSKKN